MEEGDYADYIQTEQDYLTSNRYQEDKCYWEEKYTGRPERSAIKIYTSDQLSIESKRMITVLPVSLKEQAEVYCKKNGVTPAVLFEGALISYLSLINPEHTSVTIGIPVLNRRNAKEKKMAGMFVSTMPLTIVIEKDMTIPDMLRQIKREHMQIFRHQKYPYTDILRTLREKQNFDGNLYDVMFSYQNARTETEADTRWYSNGYSEVPIVLHIDNRDDHNSYTITVDYQTRVFKDEREVQYIIDRLEWILEQIVQNKVESIKDLEILPYQEKKTIVEEFNNTYREYPPVKCIHQLFAEQAQKTPDKIALIFEGKKFTYRQVDEMSNSLAYVLKEKGIQPNDVIPVIGKRSWHVLIAILGILKSGGAYMPLDPTYPADRLQYMIDETKSKIGLIWDYDVHLRNREFINLDDTFFENLKEQITPVKGSSREEDLCYVIFTSGSSGMPKGVMITHRNLYNYLMTVQNTYQIERFYTSLVTNTFVDLSVTVMFLPILTGATLEIVNKNLVDELQYIIKKRNSVYKLTPTHMDILCDMKAALPKDSVFILGGEAVKRKNIDYICSYGRLLDEYGPTEATVGCCIKMHEKNEAESEITIGSPIANMQVYILDKQGNVLPVGVAGEMCIAGEGVSKGYLNRPELTGEKFVENPFATKENHHGKVMYHSGDLARWRADGEIEYLGRMDTQVKIRGLRIELGEIESVMSGFNGIQITAAADRKDENNRQYLVGYYTADREIDERQLRGYLSSKLPQYMVPNYFVKMNDMPMTPSGKIDRKSLPTPDFSATVQEYEPPKTEQEKKLCRLLEKLLHMEKVGAEDNFFEFGGDSLTAIEYVAKAHSLGIEISAQNVFDYPTVRKLCTFLESGEKKKKDYKKEEFEKYQSVFKKNTRDADFLPVKAQLGNVLLTGATGFLGSHVLDRLLREESGKIYCLVRSNATENGSERLKRTLNYYFGDTYADEPGYRIIPVEGDLEQDGLSQEMPSDVQTVIHTAASVKHYGSYSYFHKTNVEGTQHVIDFAKEVGAKLIHVSTLSVSGNGFSDECNADNGNSASFDERSFYMEQPLANVYIRSKFEAEKRVYDAILEGLEASVIRVGNLTNRASDYKFQPNFKENAFFSRVKAILEFGLFPDYLTNLYAEFSPIDKTAEAIVKIAQYAKKQTVFHLNSSHPILLKRFFEIIQKMGIAVKIVDEETFNEELQKTMKNRKTEYIFEAFQNDMDEQGRLVFHENVQIDNEFTQWFLKKAGFEWNETDTEYINGYIDYFRRTGSLEV